jgi:comEA protein
MIENLLNWVENNRLIIGSGLLISIIIGGVIFLWPASNKPIASDNSQKVAQLESTVKQLTDRVNELSKNSSSTVGSPNVATSANAASQTNTATTEAKTASGKVNINIATQAQLEDLPGIGPTYAQRIIDYRQANNGFKSITEIKNIKGIGDKTFDKLKDGISID